MERSRIRQFTIRGIVVLVSVASVGSLMIITIVQTRAEECRGHLAQIGLAMHNYQAIYDVLSPAMTKDPNGHPMHSWRMLILPTLESGTIFASYNLSEPWNGPSNARIAAMKTAGYACPTRHTRSSGGYSQSNLTSYVAVTGPGTLFPHDRHGSLTSPSPKELAETIVVIESVNQSIDWTEPRDLELAAYAANPDDPKLPLPSSLHPAGVSVLMADGARYAMSAREVRRRLLAMAKRGGLRTVGEKSTSRGTRR